MSELEGFNIARLQNSSVWAVYRMRQAIDPEPDYQRQSDIWTKEKKQLLIDTILNRFDVPKIYLHRPASPFMKGESKCIYAVVDGKQRLEAIWGFINGDFQLAEDCIYYHDEEVLLANLTYSEIAGKYPDIKNDFDSYLLDIVVVSTSELEIIDEMFSRLNEAVTLNAAEKRNAYPGPLPGVIRTIVSEDQFFTKCLPFGNRRYRHFDLCAKFLYSMHIGNVGDTKKRVLDKFVKDWHSRTEDETDRLSAQTRHILFRMSSVFVDADVLLKSVGMVTVYFHLFRIAENDDWFEDITREKLSLFEAKREANRENARNESDDVDLDLLEFDKHAQSPNDIYAIRFRLSVLIHRVFGREFPVKTSEG